MTMQLVCTSKLDAELVGIGRVPGGIFAAIETEHICIMTQSTLLHGHSAEPGTSQPHAELVGVGHVPSHVLVADGVPPHVHVEQLHHIVRAVDDRLALRIADPPHACRHRMDTQALALEIDYLWLTHRSGACISYGAGTSTKVRVNLPMCAPYWMFWSRSPSLARCTTLACGQATV